MREKEAVVKARIQPWLDKAFVGSTTIVHKVAHMKAKYARMETTETGVEISVLQVEQMQCMTEEFSSSTSDALKLLTELHAKMDAPAQ